MTEKEAKEQIYNYEGDLTDNKESDRDKYKEAKGYLECLEKVKILEEGLKKTLSGWHQTSDTKKALADWDKLK